MKRITIEDAKTPKCANEEAHEVKGGGSGVPGVSLSGSGVPGVSRAGGGIELTTANFGDGSVRPASYLSIELENTLISS